MLSNDTDSNDSDSVPPRVLVGVCTYNESANIESVVRAIRLSLPHADVVVVDDDSPDGTSDLVAKMGQSDPAVKLVVRRQERGLGGAIRRAIQQAIDGEYEFFLNLDGDLSHDPAQLPDLLDAARQSDRVDVVIGSRYIDGGRIEGWPLRRRIMSRTVNRFATLCLRLPVNDCSGSMRCYRVAALSSIDIKSLRCRGYALLEELLVQLHRCDAVMIEVPITFTERQRGSSKLTMREAINSAFQMIRMAVKR